MELSQKLKYLRKKKGVSQLELAERLSVSRQAVSGWEAGTSRPSTENLQSLSRLFNIPFETLLNDTLEVESVAIPEKSPVEEQVKEENKEQKPQNSGSCDCIVAGFPCCRNISVQRSIPKKLRCDNIWRNGARDY